MHLSRQQVRHIGAVASAAMATLYYLIGLGVLYIGGSNNGEMVDLAVFGGGAGTAFLILAVLLAFTDRRWVWILATLFQLFVYFVYVVASRGREPPFEIWGITLRILQLPVLAALIYLSVKAPGSRDAVAREGAAR